MKPPEVDRERGTRGKLQWGEHTRNHVKGSSLQALFTLPPLLFLPLFLTFHSSPLIYRLWIFPNLSLFAASSYLFCNCLHLRLHHNLSTDLPLFFNGSYLSIHFLHYPFYFFVQLYKRFENRNQSSKGCSES